MEANYSKDTKDLILQSTRTSYSSVLALGKILRKGPFLKNISLLLIYSLLKYYLDPRTLVIWAIPFSCKKSLQRLYSFIYLNIFILDIVRK
jgi:hypothetical protein